MMAVQTDIISQLKKDILALQGFKPQANSTELNACLGFIKYAFPNSSFPLGAIHEFICSNNEDLSASGGFIAGILSSLMSKGGISVWISSSQTIFPPSLKSFHIEPDKIIFVNLHKEKEILWTMEEALKCDGLAAVVAEIPEINLTVSRRLQLAVEQSRVTGFILRSKPHYLDNTACVGRWRITHLPGSINDVPGVSFPRWNIELIKVRNGKPGAWQAEWVNGYLQQVPGLISMLSEKHKKTG